MNAGQKCLGLIGLLISAIVAWRISLLAALILVVLVVMLVWAAGRRGRHW